MLFLRRAHSSDRPPLDSNPLPTDYETRAPTNAPPGEVRWISRGRLLKRFFDLRDEIKYLRNRRESRWPSWMMNFLNNLDFLADVTEHLDQLNTKIQGANQIFSHMYDHVRSFARKLAMFCPQQETFDFTHFPFISILSPASTEAYVSTITDLWEEFTRRFQDFSTHSIQFDVLTKSFSVSNEGSDAALRIICKNYVLPSRESHISV